LFEYITNNFKFNNKSDDLKNLYSKKSKKNVSKESYYMLIQFLLKCNIVMIQHSHI